MADIKQNYAYPASVENVFRALSEQEGLASWWTPECLIDSREGGYAKFGFSAVGSDATMRIERLVPNEVLELSCVESLMKGSREWIGTRLRFELKAGPKGGCELLFRHSGFAGESEMYRNVSQGWSHFLGTSLKVFLETGKGLPLTCSTGACSETSAR